MRLGDFKSIPLLRRFVSLDFIEGVLYVHEVRRDPVSGLTVTAKLTIEQSTNHHNKEHHDHARS